MKKQKTHAERITAALERTSFFPCLEIREDIRNRLARLASGESTYAPLEIAGIERALHSYVEASVFTRGPVWSDVRALHAAWVAAREWRSPR